MSISNYGQLKTAVANWLNRSDLTASLSTFVSLAEDNIRQDVRVRAMEQELSGTGGVVAAPAGLMETRMVLLDDKVQDYVTPNEWVADDSTGQYTILDGRFRFQKAGDYVIRYWEELDPLDADSDTNWLLTNAPDVYLWASVEQAAVFVRDDQVAGIARAQYEQAVAKLNRTEHKAQYGGPLTVRART